LQTRFVSFHHKLKKLEKSLQNTWSKKN